MEKKFIDFFNWFIAIMFLSFGILLLYLSVGMVAEMVNRHENLSAAKTVLPPFAAIIGISCLIAATYLFSHINYFGKKK